MADTPAADNSKTGAYAQKYAFYAKTIQGSAIKLLFEVLKEILHDVSMKFTPEGIRVVTLDGARCALVFLKLKDSSFEEYYCPSTITTGINMTSLHKLLKTIGSNDTVAMYQEKNNTSRLGITIENHEKNSVTNFKLNLLDVDVEDISLPKVDFDSVFTLPSTYFQRICRDMMNIGDTLHIASQDKRLCLSCCGDFASQETVICETDAMSFATSSSEKIGANFSLKYLTLFCKASSLCNTIELFLGRTLPLILMFKVASLGELKFVLAPKVDE